MIPLAPIQMTLSLRVSGLQTQILLSLGNLSSQFCETQKMLITMVHDNAKFLENINNRMTNVEHNQQLQLQQVTDLTHGEQHFPRKRYIEVEYPTTIGKRVRGVNGRAVAYPYDHYEKNISTKAYLENPSVVPMLINYGYYDGVELGNTNQNMYKSAAVNYVNNDMIFLPIRTSIGRWYLGVLDCTRKEVCVLDSMDTTEDDLKELKFLMKGIRKCVRLVLDEKIVENTRWEDYNVPTWKIRIRYNLPSKKGRTSSGLYIIKFMELWTGDSLSKQFYQEDIDNYRRKLAAILYMSPSNKLQNNIMPFVQCTKTASSGLKRLPSIWTKNVATKNIANEVAQVSHIIVVACEKCLDLALKYVECCLKHNLHFEQNEPHSNSIYLSSSSTVLAAAISAATAVQFQQQQQHSSLSSGITVQFHSSNSSSVSFQQQQSSSSSSTISSSSSTTK
uniref:Ubiquitin-like protease family profile domain-containing protein n=1 Tax=Oryza barthii TaxID=65489 RepID=A0A0D3FLH3_9ORYZ